MGILIQIFNWPPVKLVINFDRFGVQRESFIEHIPVFLRSRHEKAQISFGCNI